MALSDTADDFELRLAVESAARWIDDYCGRFFYRATQTRTFEPRDFYNCDIDDLVSVTTLKTDAGGDGVYETTWSASDYQLLPIGAPFYAEPRPYTALKTVGGLMFPRVWWSFMRHTDLVQIAGVYGWPRIPSPVKQAQLLLAADLFKLKGAPFGVANMGDFAMRIRDNNRVISLLQPFAPTPVG